MQLTVYRDGGGRQGPDVVDPLLTTETVARERGRREIDYHCSQRIVESAQCPQHDYIATGSLVQVQESDGLWLGMVRYSSLTLTLEGEVFTADTGLRIERERRR